MNVAVEHYGHCVILNLKGELSEDTLGALKQDVDTLIQDADIEDMIFNVENVPFIDSVSMEYLWDVHDQLSQQSRQMGLVGPDENLQKIIEITRMEGVFRVFHDVGEVLKALQP